MFVFGPFNSHWEEVMATNCTKVKNVWDVFVEHDYPRDFCTSGTFCCLATTCLLVTLCQMSWVVKTHFYYYTKYLILFVWLPLVIIGTPPPLIVNHWVSIRDYTWYIA